MTRLLVALSAVLLLALSPAASVAQDLGADDLNVFGYFQAQWFSQTRISTEDVVNSFNLQQINLMAQRNITNRWSAFANIQAVNTYNSALGWGSMNIEEAWLKYRKDYRLSIQVGLLIPKFNRLNEIKNRLPVIPYIIRPFVYEPSLGDAIALEEYLPRRAFVQASGFFRLGDAKLDWAIYSGNGPGVNSDRNLGQTGIDTTDVLMGGMRVGVRYKNFQFGISGTGDQIDLPAVLEDTLGLAPGSLQNIERGRGGVDFSFSAGRFDFESEFIAITYNESVAEVDLDKQFGYATLGYHIDDNWFIFVSYWDARQKRTIIETGQMFETRFKLPNMGFLARINDRVSFKGHFGTGKNEADLPGFDASVEDFDYSSLAVSVFF